MSRTRFSILDHRDSLEIYKETKCRIVAYCPSCGAKNFKISTKNGKYRAYGCSCMDTDHGKREVIRAIAGDNFNAGESAEKRAEREQREREIERQRIETCLDADKRHPEIKGGVLGQTTLKSGDHQHLVNRGVLPSIIKNCRSVTKGEFGHELSQPIHVNLPGAWKNGKGLSIPYSGILVPILDHLGRFIGLKLYDPNHKITGNPKYLWVTSSSRGISPHLPNGELPAATHYPATLTDPNTVALVEGMEFKSPACANRLGMVTMGFSGHTAIANSPQQIQATLDHTGATKIVIVPDDNCLTNSGVNSSLTTAIEYWRGKDYTVEIAWWGQTHKGVGDIDEISPEQLANIQYLTPEEFAALYPHQTPSKFHKFDDLLAKQKIKRQTPLGFIPKVGGELFTGDRVKAIVKHLEKNRYVLDASWTGDGKSHAIAPLAKTILKSLKDKYPSQTIKIYLASKSYREPKVEALTEITEMPYRHGDIVIDGHLAEKANCLRPSTFTDLSDKGYNPHAGGKDNPVCHSCPAFDRCGAAPEMFRAQRRKALKHEIIRCHPSQIPPKTEGQISVVIWDEPAEEKLTKTIETNINELDKEIAYLRRHVDLSHAHKDLLDEIILHIEQLTKTAPKLGMKNAEVFSAFTQIDQGLLTELLTILEAEQRDLFDVFEKPILATIKDNGDAFANLNVEESRKLRKQIKLANQYSSEEAYQITKKRLAELPNNGLIYLLRSLSGQFSVQTLIFPEGIAQDGQTKPGHLRLVIDRRHELAAIAEADYVVGLDATSTGQDFARLLNIDANAVKVIRRQTEQPFKNLKVVQVVVPGWGSCRPSETAIKRGLAVKQALTESYGKMPTLTYKSQLQALDADGQWFVDSRGSNQFEGNPYMLTAGLPLPNLGSIEAEFLAIGGNPDEFSEYYQAVCQKEILQDLGRQRANRYPDKQFTHFLITGDPNQNSIHDLSWVREFGADYISVHGFEVAPEAGDTSQVALWNVVEAIRAGISTGEAIAQKLNCSRRNITKLLTNAGTTLSKVTQALKSSLELGTRSYKASIRVGSHLKGLPQALLELLKINLAEGVEEVLSMVNEVGWDCLFDSYWSGLSKPIQTAILGVFWYWLDDDPPDRTPSAIANQEVSHA